MIVLPFPNYKFSKFSIFSLNFYIIFCLLSFMFIPSLRNIEPTVLYYRIWSLQSGTLFYHSAHPVPSQSSKIVNTKLNIGFFAKTYPNWKMFWRRWDLSVWRNRRWDMFQTHSGHINFVEKFDHSGTFVALESPAFARKNSSLKTLK